MATGAPTGRRGIRVRHNANRRIQNEDTQQNGIKVFSDVCDDSLPHGPRLSFQHDRDFPVANESLKVPSSTKEPSTQSAVYPLTPLGSPEDVYVEDSFEEKGKEDVASAGIEGEQHKSQHEFQQEIPDKTTLASISIMGLNDHTSLHGKLNDNDQAPEGSQFDLQLNTASWIPREGNSISSHMIHTSDHVISSPEERNREASDFDTESLLMNLGGMKIKSKRGRPRKPKQNSVNKHFKVPRRRKTKGEGLPHIGQFFLNPAHDEAESVYETGLLMGLLPINSKEESLELIRRNLAC
ncbi:hypothetical protein DCAR_0623466 [Daucus carota subsp. sativus]|uniref:Uncharacterized protein n=1 Tax=Daucus carota subsp. sativus TaxID=79200 RepID=A0A175YC31_DAUCS|nr:hypothetical protein DCAR_0623466 [Daucus carota subsp. sativus]